MFIGYIHHQATTNLMLSQIYTNKCILVYHIINTTSLKSRSRV